MYEVSTDYKYAVLWVGPSSSMIMSKHRTRSQAKKELARIHKFIEDSELQSDTENYSLIELDKDKERF